MSRAYQVRRLNTRSGTGLADVEQTEKDARRHIFYCATDNLGMSRRDATKLADSAVLGEPLAVGDYLFTISVTAL